MDGDTEKQWARSKEHLDLERGVGEAIEKTCTIVEIGQACVLLPSCAGTGSAVIHSGV